MPVLTSVVFGLPDKLRWVARQYHMRMIGEILIGAPVSEARTMLARRDIEDAEWRLARKGVEPEKPRKFLVYDELIGTDERKFDRILVSETPIFIEPARRHASVSSNRHEYLRALSDSYD